MNIVRSVSNAGVKQITQSQHNMIERNCTLEELFIFN